MVVASKGFRQFLLLFLNLINMLEQEGQLKTAPSFELASLSLLSPNNNRNPDNARAEALQMVKILRI